MNGLKMWESLFVVFLLSGIQLALAGTVKISVYYESLCPDSKEFITTQLFPTYKSIGNDIKVDFVPFGNAKILNDSGELSFKCQHGPEECYGNEIHSCALALYTVEESTEFIYCSMNAEDPSSDDTLEACANSSELSWAALKTCYSSGQGDQLLELNGIKTMDVDPQISFVPTIIFNDHYNETLQNEAVDDLIQVVCTFLEYEPVPCKNYFYDKRNKIEVKML